MDKTGTVEFTASFTCKETVHVLVSLMVCNPIFFNKSQINWMAETTQFKYAEYDIYMYPS